MTRHYYQTALDGRVVRVTRGYQRPLDSCNMTVEYLDAPADGSGGEQTAALLYSNLDDPEPYPRALAIPQSARLSERNHERRCRTR